MRSFYVLEERNERWNWVMKQIKTRFKISESCAVVRNKKANIKRQSMEKVQAIGNIRMV